jgi:AcrR family transcriptional regulator
MTETTAAAYLDSETSDTQTREHFSQGERSARMKHRLLEATIECLADQGYAGTSTTEVVKRAGVSRGALAHHFSNKAELVAEAAAYLIGNRIRTTNEMMKDVAGHTDALEKQLRLLWENYEHWFPANIEFMVAARTDPDLRSSFSTVMNQYDPSKQPDADAKSAWPDIQNDPTPVLTRYMIGCFIRGLCLERIVNDDALVEDIFLKFVAIMKMVSGSIAAKPDGSTGVEL